jgi:hypothetical protein
MITASNRMRQYPIVEMAADKKMGNNWSITKNPAAGAG